MTLGGPPAGEMTGDRSAVGDGLPAGPQAATSTNARRPRNLIEVTAQRRRARSMGSTKPWQSPSCQQIGKGPQVLDRERRARRASRRALDPAPGAATYEDRTHAGGGSRRHVVVDA